MRVLLLLVLWGLPALADEFQSLVPPKSQVDTRHVAGDWALVSFTYLKEWQEGGGQLLCRRLKGHWKTMSQDRGRALRAQDLYRAGAPRALWSKLLFSQPAAAELAALTGPCWPETAREPMTEDNLEWLEPWEITVMRNEIFARHGRAFQDPLLREYFASRDWYHVDAAYTDASLSALEKRNAAFIANYQKRKNLNF